VVTAIECLHLGFFWLGDELDAQDALVGALEAQDPCGSDSATYSEAIKSVDVSEWQAVMDDKRRSLEELEVMVEDDLPVEKKKILKCWWLLGTQRRMMGEISQRKARIIVGGHCQIKDVNYNETLALTPKFASLRIALTVAAKMGWSVASFDVKTAFLHSKINDDVWVLPPPGYPTTPGKVWKLQKALYGTKQAGRCWWLHLKLALEALGFESNPQDMSTYTVRIMFDPSLKCHWREELDKAMPWRDF
jgi:hypothetical protein